MREAGRSSTTEPIRALTVPSDIAVFFENTSFFVVKSGTSIVYTSGAKQVITEKQLEAYNYEDCTVE